MTASTIYARPPTINHVYRGGNHVDRIQAQGNKNVQDSWYLLDDQWGELIDERLITILVQGFSTQKKSSTITTCSVLRHHVHPRLRPLPTQTMYNHQGSFNFLSGNIRRMPIISPSKYRVRFSCIACHIQRSILLLDLL